MHIRKKRMQNKIEIFGVTVNKSYESKEYDLYQGQTKEYPRLDVAVFKWKNGKWSVRIEWFGNPHHNRIYITEDGSSLNEAKENVSKAFMGMIHGANAISERII